MCGGVSRAQQIPMPTTYKQSFSRSKNALFQCPIQPGAYQIDRTVTLPKEIPKGCLTPLFVSLNLLTESLPIV